MKRIVKLLLFVLVLCMSCVALAEETGTECTEHQWSDTWGFNETECWPVCANCGYAGEHSEHCNMCYSPDGECSTCGQSDVSFKSYNIDNHTYSGTWGHNETTHWGYCKWCGEEIDHAAHELDCQTGACISCGETDVQGEEGHAWNYETWYWNETECWRKCKNCQADSYHWSHTNMCYTEDGVCTQCGQSGVIFNGGVDAHAFDGTYQYDNTNHWAICLWCNNAVDQSAHRLDCQTGACRVCGANGEDVVGETGHDWGAGTWTYTDTHHTLTCACGEILDQGAHLKSCTVAENTCGNCGAENVVIDFIGHTYPWEAWKHDGTNHWHVCEACGNQVDTDIHWVDCQTGACRYCGASGVTGETEHEWDWDNWESNVTEHWINCKNCSATQNNSIHRLDCATGICRECGATDVSGEIEHDWDWETWYQDDNGHWRTCKNCPETVNYGSHWVSCKNPDACDTCGKTGLAMEPGHFLDGWDTLFFV